MSAPLAPIDPIAGPAWSRMTILSRTKASEIKIRSIPQEPGVYAWFHDGKPVYAGKASGTKGLRDRLSKHLATGLDLSRSSLRRNVADFLLKIPTQVTRQRPTRMTQHDVDLVNAWIRDLSACWLVLPTSEEAVAFERVLLSEWMPPLSRR